MIMKKNFYSFAAEYLELYVSKKGGNWLKTDDPDVLQLKEGMAAAAIRDIMKKEIDPGCRIRHTEGHVIYA
ncbi:hypothetical protein AC1031_006585 [Aphanomyces cochlioides]|nr:hypothetical protein AC1031_006585 [Aphanomyces cochlioides]